MNRFFPKKKTLSRYIIKKYLSFLIVILLLFSLIRNISALLFFGSDNLNFSRILDAGTLITPDYENTDISGLADINGWIEILDEKNRVIYTKGAALFAACTFVFLFFLLRYARAIRTHVAAPNETLVNGLREITSGNYGTRIRLNAEYEYREIEDSFNLLAEELMTATKERERLNRERRQLLSNIAHDLKTPITTLQGYAKALSDHVVKSPEQQDEYLSAIYRKSVHMTDLVNKLLEYSRLENDTYYLHPENTEFTEFVRTVIIDQYEAFENRRMELETEIPDSEICLSIDRTEIRRVLLNLLGNCIAHNPPGTSVRAVVRSDGHFCTFGLWDNGTPIPEELRDSVFEPFVCGDASRQSGNGSGLGLSICRKVAEKHGGTIVLKEGPDGYKGFILSLPCR